MDIGRNGEFSISSAAELLRKAAETLLSGVNQTNHAHEVRVTGKQLHCLQQLWFACIYQSRPGLMRSLLHARTSQTFQAVLKMAARHQTPAVACFQTVKTCWSR